MPVPEVRLIDVQLYVLAVSESWTLTGLWRSSTGYMY